MEGLIVFTHYSQMMKKGKFFLAILNLHRSKYLPSIIIGDFDSIKDDVRKYYESKGVKVTHNKD